MATSRRSWPASFLFPLDRSRDDARAKKELNSDAHGVVEADAGAEEDRPAARAADLPEVKDISDDGYTGVVGEGDDNADVEKVE